MRSLDESCTLHGPLARGKADRPATEGSLLETARARGCKPFASPSVTVRGAQGGSDGVRMVLSRNSRRVSPPLETLRGASGIWLGTRRRAAHAWSWLPCLAPTSRSRADANAFAVAAHSDAS